MLWWKFAKFLMSFSKQQVSFSSNFASLFNVMRDNSSVLFQLKQYTLCSKVECSGQNVSNSLCQFWNDKAISLQILYPSSVSWKITPLYFFSSNNIYFAQKEPIKVKIFETFECSGQNLSNSLCQFWNNNLIPLQILHPYSISWKTTSLYFFSSNKQ